MKLSLRLLAGFLLLIAPAICWSQDQEEPEPETTKAADFEEIEELLQADDEVMGGGQSSYDPEGRPDPFIPLNQRVKVQLDGTNRPEGIPGLMIDEIDLKGIVKMSGQWVGMVETSSRDKSYLLRVGDRLFDGDVVGISANSIKFKQLINDPSNFKPFREVEKQLNPEP